MQAQDQSIYQHPRLHLQLTSIDRRQPITSISIRPVDRPQLSRPLISMTAATHSIYWHRRCIPPAAGLSVAIEIQAHSSAALTQRLAVAELTSLTLVSVASISILHRTSCVPKFVDRLDGQTDGHRTVPYTVSDVFGFYRNLLRHR